MYIYIYVYIYICIYTYIYIYIIGIVLEIIGIPDRNFGPKPSAPALLHGMSLIGEALRCLVTQWCPLVADHLLAFTSTKKILLKKGSEALFMGQKKNENHWNPPMFILFGEIPILPHFCWLNQWMKPTPRKVFRLWRGMRAQLASMLGKFQLRSKC